MWAEDFHSSMGFNIDMAVNKQVRVVTYELVPDKLPVGSEA